MNNKMETSKELMGNLSKTMGMQNYLDIIKSNKTILEEKLYIFEDKEVTTKLLEVVKSMGVETIKEMSIEEIRAVYEVNGASEALELVESNLIDEEFLRDYLVSVEETERQIQEIEKLTNNFDEEIKSTMAEINELLAGMGDISSYVRSTFVESLEKADSEERKDVFRNAIQALDDATSLDPVVELFTTIGTEGTMREFLDRTERQNKIDKFYKAVKELKLHAEFKHFTDLEEKFLEEKYHGYNNLLLFLVMKYFSNKRYGKRTTDGLFITQLTILLQMLFTGNISVEKKEIFLANVRRLLDLFVK